MLTPITKEDEKQSDCWHYTLVCWHHPLSPTALNTQVSSSHSDGVSFEILQFLAMTSPFRNLHEWSVPRHRKQVTRLQYWPNQAIQQFLISAFLKLLFMFLFNCCFYVFCIIIYNNNNFIFHLKLQLKICPVSVMFGWELGEQKIITKWAQIEVPMQYRLLHL